MTKGENKSTLRDRRAPAIVCRERGWGPGTRIAGDEGYGETVIEITAVGEQRIMARMISHKGEISRWASENMWVLDGRDWRQV